MPPRGRRRPRRPPVGLRLRFDPRLRAGGDNPARSAHGGHCEFRPTPPRGRRQPGYNEFNKLPWFRPTPPRGRRPRAVMPLIPAASFDPRLRAGGDLERALDHVILRVSTHASAREATFRRGLLPATKRFRPTPPRGRRPRQDFTSQALDTVSTHASAREATFQTWLASRDEAVSTHASAREATCRP